MTNNCLQFVRIGLAAEKLVLSNQSSAQIISRNTTRGIKMKQCSKCQEIKSETDFHKHTQNKDGLQSICKRCRNLTARIYRKTNLGLIKEINKRFQLKHLNYQHIWEKNNKEQRRIATKIQISKRPALWCPAKSKSLLFYLPAKSFGLNPLKLNDPNIDASKIYH